MKKHLTEVLLVIAFVLSVAGCASAAAGTTSEGPGEQIEEALEAAENKIRQKIRSMMEPAAENAITKDDARRIALEHLGLTADQVKDLRTDYEISDGVSRYDVEFQYGDWEYEFEIHGATGKILHFDKDHKSD